MFSVEMIRSVPPSLLGFGVTIVVIMIVGYAASILDVLIGPLI
jgi:hypothetical protein